MSLTPGSILPGERIGWRGGLGAFFIACGVIICGVATVVRAV